MHIGKIVFSQVIEHLPMHTFRRCVQRYDGNHKIKSFSCLDQFLCMTFAQLTYRESLRDIEACLRAQREKLYHMGIRGGISRNTLSNANKVRDWRIYADFAQALIKIARPLYAEEDLGLDLDNTVYALDASTIDLCLSIFPWALFRSTKSAVKLHTLLDLRGNIPTWQAPRRQCTRYPDTRAWSLLHHGQRLPGFWKAFQYGSGRRIFRHPSQAQYPVPTSLLPFSEFCGSRSEMRPDHRIDWRQHKGRLPSTAATDQIPRQQNRQNFQLPGQQHKQSPTCIVTAGR